MRFRNFACWGELLRLSDDPQIRLERLPALGKFLLRLLFCDRSWNDHVVARFPVYGRGDVVLSRQLQRVQDPKHLIKIAPAAHGIAEHELDFLVGADDEYGTNCGVVYGS